MSFFQKNEVKVLGCIENNLDDLRDPIFFTFHPVAAPCNRNNPQTGVERENHD